MTRRIAKIVIHCAASPNGRRLSSGGRTAAVYLGDPRYQERATVAREQFGFECW